MQCGFTCVISNTKWDRNNSRKTSNLDYATITGGNEEIDKFLNHSHRTEKVYVEQCFDICYGDICCGIWKS